MSFLLTKTHEIKRIVGDTKEGYLICDLGSTIAHYTSISYDDVIVIDSNISYLEHKLSKIKGDK